MIKRDLNNKIALLTGASGGIGQATAIRLSQSGMRLALCGRNADKLKAVSEKTAHPDENLLLPIPLDGSEAVEKVFSEVITRFGALDALINNAGMALNKPFEAITEAEYDQIMLLNAKIPFLMCQRALPLLRKSASPAIINIGSVVAHDGYADQAAYVASKHALIGFTKSLAKEVYKENIRVHMISPGSVYTDMIRIARPDLPSDGMIMPEEIAELIAYLLESGGNGIIDEIRIHRTGKEPFLS